MMGPARVLVVGPLMPFADGFFAQLINDGYSPSAAGPISGCWRM